MEQTPGTTRYNNHSCRVSDTQQKILVLYVILYLAFLQTYQSFATNPYLLHTQFIST